MEKMKVEQECYHAIYKVVKTQTSSGVVYVPKSWIGKNVRILLLDPLEEKE